MPVCKIFVQICDIKCPKLVGLALMNQYLIVIILPNYKFFIVLYSFSGMAVLISEPGSQCMHPTGPVFFLQIAPKRYDTKMVAFNFFERELININFDFCYAQSL